MPAQDREDLGAMFARLTRALIEAERPLLDAHGLSMWGYVTLSHLVRAPAETQLALAQAIGYDKTRLIGVLDELEQAGLITREPDPDDRRAHVVRITARGRERRTAAVASIRAMEEEFLSGLGAAERRALLASLVKLTARDDSV
jgi:DNA-binding MarR family transcriptional regulator